jgi:hypothetical protein
MKNLFLPLLLCCFHLAVSQNKFANNWLLSGIGLNFNTNPVSILPNVPTKVSPFGSSFSDENGNLLFYTDGTIIYDRQNRPMPNGRNILCSSFGTTLHTSGNGELAVIMPNPTNKNLFYVFVNGHTYCGLSYSIVDMRLNGGFGDVTQKNIRLIERTNQGMVATIGNNCINSWVVVHHHIENIYYSFRINENGVNHNPVRTQIGTKFGLAGGLFLSPDSRKLVSLESLTDTSPPDPVFLYDFDVNTGNITNRRMIAEKYLFTMEFSPNSQFLYANYRAMNNTCFNLMQLDLTLPNDQIINSAVGIVCTRNNLFLNIRLAPDNKIYLIPQYYLNSNEPLKYLHTIENPNEKGANCNFRENAITLPAPPRNDDWGVFPFFARNNQLNTEGIIHNSICKTLTVNFKAPIVASTYLWNFGDNTTSTVQNPTKTYTQAGTYLVKVKIGSCEFAKTITIQKPATLNPKPALNLCPAETGNFGISPETGYTYRWFPDTGLSAANIANPSIILDNQADTVRKITYKVIATSSTNGCKDSASMVVSVSPALKKIAAGKDTTICHLQVYRLAPAGGVAPQPPAGGIISPPAGANLVGVLPYLT